MPKFRFAARLAGAAVASLVVLASSSAQQPEQASAMPEKLTVACPPTLNLKRTAAGVLRIEGGKPLARYSFEEHSDALEGTTTRFFWLKEHFGSEAATPFKADSLGWNVRCITDEEGKMRLDIAYSVLTSHEMYSLHLAPNFKGGNEIELLYRANGKLQRLVCSEAVSKSSALATYDQRVTFACSADNLLDFADCGTIRIKYPGGQKELTMDEDDRAAFRWFVWEKVPGGQSLLGARYTLSPPPANGVK